MATSTSTIASEDKVQTVDEIAAELQAEQDAKNAPVEDVEDTVQDSGSERPAWLPEKFKSPEDMAKAYSELEKKQSGKKPDDKEGLDIAADQKAAEEAVENAGLDFNALSAKYAEKGELEESDYAALEKSGLPRDTVDMFVRGQEALAKQYEETVMSSAGGKENYSAMTSWAADALSQSQKDAFNEAVNSGDVEKASLAIDGLKSKYEAANGKEPGRRVSSSPSTGGSRYESKHEWTKDMEDPRYWKDEGYRAKVERKFAATWGG